MTEAQKCLYHIAENMRMDKSISKEGYEYFQQAIKALEQEPQTDEIILSKKEYRELLSDEFEHGYDKGLSDAITSLEQEPCEDCISRKAAIDELELQAKEMSQWSERYMEQAKGVLTAKNIIKDLPPVTLHPKTGHWIEQIDHEENCRTLICSNCDRPALHDEDSIWKHKFCPHCGAKMVEPQESEDEE